jgi:hypothetical protein
VEEMKEEVTTDWPGTGSVLAQHPGLVAELAGIDARLEELAGQEATTREPGQGEQEAQPVEQDGGVEDEEGKDDGRAQRNVATVRPPIAALRYVRPQAPADPDRQRSEEGVDDEGVHEDGVAAEEGG